MANKNFEFEFERSLEQRLSLTDDVADAHNSAHVATVPLRNRTDILKHLEEESPDFDVANTRRHLIKTENGNFWISGNSILCECPDCQAPMTVRIWLRLADCWRCGTSTRLTQEQIDAIEAFTENVVETTPAIPVAQPGTHIQSPPADTNNQYDEDAPTDGFIEELDQLTQQRTSARVIRKGLAGIPAWLISFLLHLLLILLLALFVFSHTNNPPTITLSSFVGTEKSIGGEIRMQNPDHEIFDDLPMANDMEIDKEELRQVIQKAQEDAKEILEDEQPMAQLPEINEVRKNVTTDRDQLMSFAARDPRVRSEIVRKEGGTTLTEASVSRGLRWLAQVQNYDGSWSLSDYDQSHRKDNEGDAAATSLALLPFLGAGQTHEFGIYRRVVARGLTWLIENQKSDGDLRINFPGQAGMYAHGQATIVLCEALAMTGDQRFKAPAEKAIRFIEKAQNRRGGWRYTPGQSGDTSMLGWQLMALQSARAGNLGIEIDNATFELADYYLDQAIDRKRRTTGSMKNMPLGSLYVYRPGEGESPTPSMTAEAILCRMYLGWQRNDPRVIEAVRWLIEHNLPTTRNRNIYYWYYATQVMHHFGGPVWDVWNKRMREILVGGQTQKGRFAGSWSPQGYQWGRHGGRIYVTSLSICTLEVYYRHLPIFKQIDLDQPVSARR